MHSSLRPATPLLLVLALAACGGQRYAPSSPTAVASSGPAVAEAPPPPPPTAAATAVLSGPPPGAPVDERPGLATTWGESTWSPMTTTPFVRADAAPWATAVLHYNDAEGVAAHAAYLGAAVAPLEAWASPGDVAVSLVDEHGGVLPGIAAGGRNLVAATDGSRYRIAVRNLTDARFEVIASVDGLDVIDGRAAGFDRRGYVLEAHGSLVIDGFRQSSDQVAAFRFGAVAASYAARSGDDRNVGVIGVALFAERGARYSRDELERRDRASPFPGEPGRTFAQP